MRYSLRDVSYSLTFNDVLLRPLDHAISYLLWATFKLDRSIGADVPSYRQCLGLTDLGKNCATEHEIPAKSLLTLYEKEWTEL